MDSFYAYIVDDDGHVINRVEQIFERQEDAEERAKALVDLHDVELWQWDRKLTTFKRAGDESGYGFQPFEEASKRPNLTQHNVRSLASLLLLRGRGLRAQSPIGHWYEEIGLRTNRR